MKGLAFVIIATGECVSPQFGGGRNIIQSDTKVSLCKPMYAKSASQVGRPKLAVPRPRVRLGTLEYVDSNVRLLDVGLLYPAFSSTFGLMPSILLQVPRSVPEYSRMHTWRPSLCLR